MIALTRVRTPAAIPPDFRGKRRIDLNLDLLNKKLDGVLDGATSEVWDSSVWKAAKAQLLKESSGKCAYCESPATIVAFGDVEHFRPKSRYWWLAYCYENYLAACTVCNQKFKQDAFIVHPAGKPLAGPLLKAGMSQTQLRTLAKRLTVDPLQDSEGMPMKSFLAAVKKERALIVDPYIQDPADFFAYLPIPANKEVLVVPARSAYKAVVDACDKLYGINRQELRDERFRHYATYMTYKYVQAVPELPAKLRKSVGRRLSEMTAGSLRYTGMIRYLETRKLEDLPWDFEL